MRFQIFKDAKGEFRWRLIANQGRVLATAAEGYKTKAECRQAIQLIKDARVVDLAPHS
jgi:uncharacterized protein YegP (UPF0339 family)